MIKIIKILKTKKKDNTDKFEKDKERKDSEINYEILQNPARVLRQQLKVIQLTDGSHYVPVKDLQIGGIVMVKHVQNDKEEELVEPVAAFGPKPEEEKESEPPEPFEFNDD